MNLGTLIKGNTDIIGVVLAILTLIAAIFGIYFAWIIFGAGLQSNRDKVLDEFSLELVTEFIIPYKELRLVLRLIQENIGNSVDHSKIEINIVYEVIKSGMFQVEFPYFGSHKGDIWNSLQVKKKNIISRFCRYMVYHVIKSQDDYITEDRQAKDYKEIVEFIDKANRFCTGLKVTEDALYKYINGNESGESKKGKGKDKGKEHEHDTLADFYNAEDVRDQDKRFLKDGIVMMKELDEKINNLPERLRIDYMKARFQRQ